jgi:hypothetical protein
MQIVKLLTIFLTITLFLTACNTDQPEQSLTVDSNTTGAVIEEPIDDYWAKDNFDLQRVGALIERSDNPEEFERYLNNDDGINNLDLNGDGYVDYISVREFGDDDSDARGLSLFSRYGPDVIQEIATIFFYRDEPRYPGSRVLLYGNEQLYGDNHYYETNWLDRSIGLVSLLFSDRDRDRYYTSPYYYDNYPDWYEVYPVVETPIYRSRVVNLYPEPAFVYTTAPAFLSRIKIKSPNNGLHLGQIHARLVKPTREQADFIKNNPKRRQFSKYDRRGGGDGDKFRGDDKPGRDDPPRSDRGDDRGNPGRDDRGAERGNPNKPAKQEDHGGKGQGQPGNPNKGGGNPKAGDQGKGGENPNKGGPGKGGGNPNKGGGKGKP